MEYISEHDKNILKQILKSLEAKADK